MYPILALTGTLLLTATTAAADYDYQAAGRQLIRNGVQAVITCNGLFTSQRSLEQVFAQELAFLGDRRLGDASGGNYRVSPEEQWVEVGGGDDGPAITAAFRTGIGCVVMAPGMTAADIPTLPQIEGSSIAASSQSLPWPQGEVVTEEEPDPDISQSAIQQASDWAFHRDSPEQDTISLLIVHKGQLIHERYAEGFDWRTRTRTWSTAKSIASALIGIQVDRGELQLDQPLPFDWLPEVDLPEQDPRRAITLRHALHMSSGLYPVDSFGMEYATGSGLAYWAGASSVAEMRKRGLIRAPGTFFDYENYDTLLAVYALKASLKTDAAYRAFPRSALLERIGMRNTLIGTDRFGDFILSSQVYSNARDLARFGLLHLQQGNWQGQQIISPEWIDFVRSPAPASTARGHAYGGQWWLVPDDRKHEVPPDAFTTAGNRGQYVIVVPSHDLVIVRRGLDYGSQGFDPWSLLREVLKAFQKDDDP